MSSDRPADHLLSLVHELCALPRETEWVELKVSEAEPQAVGAYISALANAAALMGKGVRVSRLGRARRGSCGGRDGVPAARGAVEAGLIVIADPEAGTRSRNSLPFWAAPRPDRGKVV